MDELKTVEEFKKELGRPLSKHYLLSCAKKGLVIGCFLSLPIFYFDALETKNCPKCGERILSD